MPAFSIADCHALRANKVLVSELWESCKVAQRKVQVAKRNGEPDAAAEISAAIKDMQRILLGVDRHLEALVEQRTGSRQRAVVRRRTLAD